MKLRVYYAPTESPIPQVPLSLICLRNDANSKSLEIILSILCTMYRKSWSFWSVLFSDGIYCALFLYVRS